MHIMPWLQKRPNFGAYPTLMQEFKLDDHNEYEQFLRLSPQLFEELLEMLNPLLKKEDTEMRESLCPKLKLAATLRFLATRACYLDLQHLFRIYKSTLSKIIPETCGLIYDPMKSRYLKVWFYLFKYSLRIQSL